MMTRRKWELERAIHSQKERVEALRFELRLLRAAGAGRDSPADERWAALIETRRQHDAGWQILSTLRRQRSDLARHRMSGAA